MKKIVLLSLVIIALLGIYNPLEAKTKYAIGLTADKSVAVIVPSKDVSNYNGELINSIFTINGTGIFKISRNTYFRFDLGYTTYSYEELYALDVTATSTDLKIQLITYFDKPDDFTPYLSYGGGIGFVSEERPTPDNEFLNTNYLDEFSFMLGGKFGLNIPLNENLVLDPGISIEFYTQTEIGIVPKLSIGVEYWLD